MKLQTNTKEKIRPIGPVKSVVIDGLFKPTKVRNPYIKTKTELKKPAKVWEYNNEY
jgi:hypothetical protein